MSAPSLNERWKDWLTEIIEAKELRRKGRKTSARDQGREYFRGVGREALDEQRADRAAYLQKLHTFYLYPCADTSEAGFKKSGQDGTTLDHKKFVAIGKLYDVLMKISTIQVWKVAGKENTVVGFHVRS